MRVWLYFGLGASLFLGACGHAREARNRETAAAKTAVMPVPQPTVCAAENLSRAALMQQAKPGVSPAPTSTRKNKAGK